MSSGVGVERRERTALVVRAFVRRLVIGVRARVICVLAGGAILEVANGD
jgi:hypothetical protein